MKELRLSVCFEDKGGNVVSKRLIESNWSVDSEQDLKKHYSKYMMEEIANILCIELKRNLTPDVIKEMLDEMKGE